MLEIREATDADFERIWSIFQPTAAADEIYAYAPDVTKAEGRHLWMELPRKTFVADDDGELLGTYYIKTNQAGPGAHVCNGGYMVAITARGRGIATAMCEHSQKIALELGYEAMQFNFVASTNEGAVRLWQKFGFEIVGRLPGAFKHPLQGNVDALVMYKWLTPVE